MGLRAIPLSPSQSGLIFPPTHVQPYLHCRRSSLKVGVVVFAKKENGEEEGEAIPKRKQNLFESVTEALDFAQVRSARDAELLEEARQATKSGDQMSREQVLLLLPPSTIIRH